MKKLIENWKVSMLPEGIADHICPEAQAEVFAATVPGSVHYDLIREGKLDNPYASTENAFAAAWVAQNDWLYEAVFPLPEDIQAYPNIFLKFNGIDTYSEIWLNGQLIGETEDAYIVYEFPVDAALLKEENVLKVRVKAHERMIEDRKADAAKYLKRTGPMEGMLGKTLIRRYQRNFYTTSSLLNIGTGVIGIGINRTVELVLEKEAYIKDAAFLTESASEEASVSRITVELEGYEGTEVTVTLSDADGVKVFEKAVSPESDVFTEKIELTAPKLWWPNGSGEQYLYELEVSVSKDGKVLDTVNKLVGIRKIRVLKKTPEGKHTFCFEVNGRSIITHGQNYIPMDYIKVYAAKEKYENLFRLLKNQNVNLVRLWGGGAVEDDWFFTECDRQGIMIWQDMFLHSNPYPEYDPAYSALFKREVAGILRTLRSHACIALICGGNEQYEGWDEYGWKQDMDFFYGSTFTEKTTPDLVKEICPEIDYFTNSPYGGKFAQSPCEGDTHTWFSFYNAYKDPLFVTETCWTIESYSRPETLKKIMGLDVDDLSAIRWGDKWKEITSLDLITRRPFSSCFDIDSLRGYLYGLEVEQARADYQALNVIRYLDPSNRGIIYWDFNKGGPLFQFGCVDYDLRPMMPYYTVKRLYNNVGIFPYRDFKDIRVMLSNHDGAGKQVHVEAYLLDESSNIIEKYENDTFAESNETKVALNLPDLYDQIIDRTKRSLFVKAFVDGECVSEDLYLFCPYTEIEYEMKPVQTSITEISDGVWELTVSAEGLVQSLEIEGNIKFYADDNYFPMLPGDKKVIRLYRLNDETNAEVPEFTVSLFGDKEGKFRRNLK